MRHLLVALFLCLAQIGANAHAIEHALGEAQGVPAHQCEQCLSAHDLGAALPSLAALPPVPPTTFFFIDEAVAPGFHLLPPQARQGAPPHA